MKPIAREPKVCPLCGKKYYEPSALSREDNKTPICPSCATLEALRTIGVEGDEAEKILAIINRSRTEAENNDKDR